MVMAIIFFLFKFSVNSHDGREWCGTAATECSDLGRDCRRSPGCFLSAVPGALNSNGTTFPFISLPSADYLTLVPGTRLVSFSAALRVAISHPALSFPGESRPDGYDKRSHLFSSLQRISHVRTVYLLYAVSLRNEDSEKR